MARDRGAGAKNHPRVCGDQRLSICIMVGTKESPPRVRGSVIRHVYGSVSSGITPACAGISPRLHFDARQYRNHPRVCGDQQGVLPVKNVLRESPPRVRGSDEDLTSFAGRSRITPACAGIRWMLKIVNGRIWNHPRVCGDQAKKQQEGHAVMESPPRVRGSDWGRATFRAVIRITPACAGIRRHRRSIGIMFRNHPRVCGDQNARGVHHTAIAESPPRVRGSANAVNVLAFLHGITPACAGISCCRRGDPPK